MLQYCNCWYLISDDQGFIGLGLRTAEAIHITVQGLGCRNCQPADLTSGGDRGSLLLIRHSGTGHLEATYHYIRPYILLCNYKLQQPLYKLIDFHETQQVESDTGYAMLKPFNFQH